MAKTLRRGDRVEWNSHGGKRSSKGQAVGKVLRKLTKPITIKGTTITASEDDPRYLVRSDNGGRAAHKPGALRKLSKRATAKSEKKAGKKAAKLAEKKAGKKRAAKKRAAKKRAAKKRTAET